VIEVRNMIRKTLAARTSLLTTELKQAKQNEHFTQEE
jgi:hypothetical protein